MTNWEAPQDLDSACYNLCVALNYLPGIKTTDSCCGHGEAEYRIWFKMDSSSMGAVILSRCLSGRYYNYAPGELRRDPVWRVYLADTEGPVNFLLEGKPMKGDLVEYAAAEKLAQNLQRFVEHDFSEGRRLRRA